VEINGRSIAFEYGLLVRRRATPRRPESWHVSLLRVPSQDMLWAESEAGQECEIYLQTQRGERLKGRASLISRSSAPDSLRLIGIVALRDD
jgi:hypothetical protein